MGIESPSLESVFSEAIEIDTADRRAEYLERACAGDENLRARVQTLLDAHFRAGSFLVQPSPELDVTREFSRSVEQPGQRIGPYVLREKLGEGGFGMVWAAEQLESVRRKVALKIIKPGMDTNSVVARFEAERQALALMDHPNIARVFDAGTTEQGRPYFVMELIRGVSITAYCDENKLTVGERLNLFVQVCRAIQHAHQKGIIHRDIKPSNVLVTLHDGIPVPKVIDFGVAKALTHRLTDRTVYTGVHQAIGTLPYMSPEQAELSGLDVDTRADIYGLGVLLYELLTGDTPFDRRRLEEAAWQEACRIIREEEPPKPSTRISSLGGALTSVAAQRRSDPRNLPGLMKGDLDWIVMKALEKDRTRRYETAKDFAADVQRYIGQEPIEARPPSTLYRCRKFARRNRNTLATCGLVLAIVVGASSVAVRTSLRAVQIDRLRMAAAKEIELRDALQRALAPGDEGKPAESSLLLRNLLSERLMFSGANHPETRLVQYHHAIMLLRQGELEQALSSVRELCKPPRRSVAGLGEREGTQGIDELVRVTIERVGRVAETDSPERRKATLELARIACEFDAYDRFYALAWACYVNGDYVGSLDALERQLEVEGQTHHWLLLTRVYAKLSNLDAARACYAVACDRIARLQGPDNRNRSLVAAKQMASDFGFPMNWLDLTGAWPPPGATTEEFLAFCSLMAELHPKADAPYRFRGTYHAFLGDWELALSDYAESVKCTSTNRPECWTALAAITLYHRGTEDYVDCCREVERASSGWSRRRWLFDSNLAIIRSLGECGGVDREAVYDLARLAATRQPAEAVQGDLAYAMAAYRAGFYEESLYPVRWLSQHWTAPIALAFGAMAQHQLGKEEQARDLLQKARDAAQQWVSTVSGPPPHWGVERPALYCMARLALGEAEMLIDKKLTAGILPPNKGM